MWKPLRRHRCERGWRNMGMCDFFLCFFFLAFVSYGAST
jgi:hypothetical protein